MSQTGTENFIAYLDKSTKRFFAEGTVVGTR